MLTKDIAETICKKVNEFYKEIEIDQNARYRSWEHCYNTFYTARSKRLEEDDYDKLSLHLAFYLASWGMYRGSSFLLQKDYKVHIPVVKILLESKYDSLQGIQCRELEGKYDICQEVGERLTEYYKDVRNDYYKRVKKELKNGEDKISETLITKILMGTLGCVPAYDRYFVSGIRATKTAVGQYCTKSLKSLIDFYSSNEDLFESAREKFYISSNVQYPQMKLLDMGFWEIGYDVEEKKKEQKNI